MKTAVFVMLPLAALLFAGCAAQLRFVDRSTGQVYLGHTGSTLDSSGTLTAKIAGQHYEGHWVYTPDGGSYTLRTANVSAFASSGTVYATASAYGSSTTITQTASGHGLIIMHGDEGGYIRCVFDFNTLSNTGIGRCRSQNGRLFDVMIER